MNNNSLVSIIMNCYNSEQYLKEAIDSIYSQTYQNWEIIFWDNASTDNSSNIANSYDNRVKYYLALETVSLGKARNFALEKASGEYIAFLDCDDVYSPDKLQKQVKLMHNKNYAMCYGSAVIINERGKEIKRNIVKNKSGNIFSNLLMNIPLKMVLKILNR